MSGMDICGPTRAEIVTLPDVNRAVGDLAGRLRKIMDRSRDHAGTMLGAEPPPAQDVEKPGPTASGTIREIADKIDVCWALLKEIDYNQGRLANGLGLVEATQAGTNLMGAR